MYRHMKNKTLTVVFATDNNGIGSACVAVASLVRACKNNRPLHIIILNDGLDDDAERSLLSATKGFDSAKTEFVDIRVPLAKHLDFLRSNSKQWAYLTWARCFIDTILPDLDGNVLYLDTDVFVVDDVSQLLDTDIGENVFAAVPESIFETSQGRYEQIGLPKEIPFYFNAGVLMFNITAYKKAGGGERVMAIADEIRDRLAAPDQDVLNLMADGKVYALHPRWNCNDGHLDRQFKFSLKAAALYRGNPTRKILEAVLSPGILHFQGKSKPWRQNHRPERKRYFKLMKELGYSKTFLPGASPTKLLGMVFFDVYHAMLKLIARARLAIGR